MAETDTDINKVIQTDRVYIEFPRFLYRHGDPTCFRKGQNGEWWYRDDKRATAHNETEKRSLMAAGWQVTPPETPTDEPVAVEPELPTLKPSKAPKHAAAINDEGEIEEIADLVDPDEKAEDKPKKGKK